MIENYLKLEFLEQHVLYYNSIFGPLRVYVKNFNFKSVQAFNIYGLSSESLRNEMHRVVVRNVVLASYFDLFGFE